VARVPLPVLEDVVPPQPAGLGAGHHEPDAGLVGAVLVANTWTVDPADRADFVDVMQELRRVRLQTGAFRWRLYRSVDDPDRLTELFVLPSWDEHLRQHDRLDAEAADIIARARRFDVAGGPLNRHLVSVDVTDDRAAEDWERQVALHSAMHETDGSLPLRPDDTGDLRMT
jgi:hypothetical protein